MGKGNRDTLERPVETETESEIDQLKLREDIKTRKNF